MIVLDTNVISEMMREEPDPKVLAWIDTVGQLHTTAVTFAEVDYGIARLPVGRRKDRLTAIAARVFADFDDVILPVDVGAGHRYAGIVAGREVVGRPITTADAQIASICRAHEAALATRNVADFQDTGIEVIDPWLPA